MNNSKQPETAPANDEKLDFNFLEQRGFIPTCAVGVANTVYNKWGFELDIHANFVYCLAKIPRELVDKISYNIRISEADQMPSIQYKWELLELEKLMEIDSTPIMSKMSVDELKSILPPEYEYILDESKKYIKTEYQRSYNTARGRYIIKKGEEIICNGYNDEEESYFLCHSLLYILQKEKQLPTNSIALKNYQK